MRKESGGTASNGQGVNRTNGAPAETVGRMVGQIAPDFALPDPATNKTERLSDRRGQDVLLLFLRGTWCPFCREQLKVLSAAHDKLTAAGIAVLAVSCQSAASIGRFVRGNPLPFPLLADERREVAKAFGVHYYLSLEGFNLANPSLFILDKEGVVTFAYIGRNMADLPLTTILEKFVTFVNDSE